MTPTTQLPIAERLASSLDEVARRFNAELLSDLACVNQLTAHVERYRGKMLRPQLTLLAGWATDPGVEVRSEQEPSTSQETLVVIATVCEMVHMATLVHDDILDEAEMRRRGATLNHLHGNEAAVMLGDYLISHAYHLCSALEDVDGTVQHNIARHVAATTNTVCEGELLQLANRNRLDLDERTYFEIIRRKTAALTAACCRLGAVATGADLAVAVEMEAFGSTLGIAFQIADDLLDLAGDPDTVGKSLHRDLAKGKLTLPVIRHLATALPEDRRAVRRLLESADALETQREDDCSVDDQEHRTERLNVLATSLVERLLDGDAINWSRQRAMDLATEAEERLCAAVPDSPARAMLVQAARGVVNRAR